MDGLSERLAAEEEGIGTSMESFQKCLEEQKFLFHSQLDEMQRVLITQCQLTGVNPLSQEMAAGALGIPIGKKPRDLLNPKAVVHMLEIFAIKDKLSKKETREISAQFGITLSQVRDFFASQRTIVREIVQSSQELFRDRAKLLKESQNGNHENKTSVMLCDPVPMLTSSHVLYDTNMPMLTASHVPCDTNMLMLTVSPVPCDTNMTNIVKTETNETVSASTRTANTNRCDSPEFSLATCIPISDEEDIPNEPCKSESAPQKFMSSTLADHLPLNIVPLTTSEPLVSNNAGINIVGKQLKLRQEEILPGLDGSDQNFVENIFNLMSKEKTFSGQVKLMEGILKIENPSLLDWFLTKGGVMVLATWLGEAALEEQTSVLHVILKVLCHLPLAKAVPEHMSVILQSVNSLRFYRAQEISKKARILLARWSKLFAKSQPMRTTNGVKSRREVAKQSLLSQSINEIISDESRHLQLENTDVKLTSSTQASANLRKIEQPVPMELLTSSANEYLKRKSLGPSSSQGKDRRKVQLVEHPGQKSTGRSQQGVRASVSQSRPVSTDDIQKAKLRKEFMEAKYGKKNLEIESAKQGINQASPVSTHQITHQRSHTRLPMPIAPKRTEENKQNLFPLRSTNEVKQHTVPVQSGTVKHEEPAVHLLNDTKEPPMMLRANTVAAQSLTPVIAPSSNHIQSQAYPENDAELAKPVVSINVSELLIKSKGAAEQGRPVVLDSNNIALQNVYRPKKATPESKEPFWKQCKRVQIPWKTPTAIVIDKEWRVVSGQNSREFHDQKIRNKREKEFVYQRHEEIPQNPKNPWENEIDYDDTLTPIIAVELVHDTIDTSQTQSSMFSSTENESQMPSVPSTGISIPLSGGVSGPVHDPVLLDALLKNPDLVFTLTSGQCTNMTSEETVRLLDLIKATGGTLTTGNIAHSLSKGVPETNGHIVGSLPSPTPSSNYGTSGWQPEAVRNPFTRNSPTPTTSTYAYPGATAPAYDRHPSSAHLANTQLASANNVHRQESPTPQYPSAQTLGAQYISNFSSSVLHSPTPHAETISSVKPYHHPIPNEPGMLENRSAAGYNHMQMYSSYAPGQSHHQPAYPSSGGFHSQPIYDHQPHLQSSTYGTAGGGQYRSQGSLSDSWRQRGSAADPYPQVNSNHYGTTHRYKDENVTSLDQFESWSPPHNAPIMPVDYVSGSSQPRTAYGSNYRPDQTNPMKYTSGYGGTNQNGNKWWNDHDRRR